MTTAVLSSKGQITVSRVVRRKLGLGTGNRVEFVELADGQFPLAPAIATVRTLKGIVPKPRRPVSVAEMRRIVAKRRGGK